RVKTTMRSEENKSLKGLCIENSIPYQTLVNQRAQGRYPNTEVLMMMSDYLSVSVDWLLFGTQSNPEQKLYDIALGLKESVENELKNLLVKENQ
ncbi:MAG: hypothetical protein K6F82_02370, partial [Sphaerochaetaceae bacterium]|nr:hypothetical protein [Sphaerochaetaceae bacterium]